MSGSCEGILRMTEWVEEALLKLDQSRLRRRLTALRPLSPVEALIFGHRVVLFSTNDYLGLSQHPRVIERVLEFTERMGLGPRAASLLSGYTEIHEQLEQELARFKGTEAALLFPTGYMANLGILQALGTGEVHIFSDALNHASLIDGCRLAKAHVHVYRHADVDHLESLLRSSRAQRKIIVTDAYFSMDGDVAPLAEIVALKEKYGCLLLIDEAHSTLVFGRTGKGVAEHFGVSDRVEFQMGTLSKAFGSLGGYVATSRKFKAYLLNRARSFIFTTSLPLPAVVAALAALDVFRADPTLRAALCENIELFSKLLRRTSFSGRVKTDKDPRLQGPIFPLIVGDAAIALALSERLLEAGYHVPAIRPPTVPPGTARLRISLSARHHSRHLHGLITVLADQRVRVGTH